ncbi:GNAT family N-acetyltransferase [Streptomyces sp. N2-109]|uniref:GNAT family N-acetyltransferase n=1 Tax=Streptomyces gossypii TaxID=2883101 RepID=A0ABT2K552_9ACTN|nr:GNAT family N-acetyltransferase [Streptomyces gossypii]MCT2594754.1 GNAT family N-acetyltransferase [Streptomyces gossypii]
MTSLRFRAATLDDAERIALLHADSWRRHYRGTYADSFLDGDDLLPDRRAVWSSRLAAQAGTMTIVAEDGTDLVGFGRVAFDNDGRWGSLLDNLHVTHDRQRTGTGTALLTRCAAAVAEQAASTSLYLWVLEQNTAAQGFYRALGGTCVEHAEVPPPGGVPARLHGTPAMFRLSWPDASALAPPTGA